MGPWIKVGNQTIWLGDWAAAGGLFVQQPIWSLTETPEGKILTPGVVNWPVPDPFAPSAEEMTFVAKAPKPLVFDLAAKLAIEPLKLGIDDKAIADVIEAMRRKVVESLALPSALLGLPIEPAPGLGSMTFTNGSSLGFWGPVTIDDLAKALGVTEPPWAASHFSPILDAYLCPEPVPGFGFGVIGFAEGLGGPVVTPPGALASIGAIDSGGPSPGPCVPRPIVPRARRPFVGWLFPESG